MVGDRASIALIASKTNLTTMVHCRQVRLVRGDGLETLELLVNQSVDALT